MSQSQPAITVPVLYGVGSGGSRIAATAVHGVGPGGRRISQRLEGVEAVCISSSRMDIEQLKPYTDRWLYVIGDGSGSGMNPEKGRVDYLDSPHRDEITDLPKQVAGERGFSRIDLIPVIFTVGFGCGSGAGPQLIADLTRKYPDSSVLGICVLPFDWEGEDTRRRAVKALERACKHAPVIPASNSYLIGGLLQEDFTKALNTVNERIVKPLTAMLRGMSSTRAITAIDSSDLRRVLKPDPVLVMHWSLPTPAEIANLSQHNSNTLAPIGRGYGRVSCIAVIEAGRGGFTPAVTEALPEQLGQILQARATEVKTLITRRPEAGRTNVTILVGGVKLYA